MWNYIFTKHYSYKDLCHYLEHKYALSDKEKEKISSHIDSCKVCWSTWNRVRWDAAWVKDGTQELREYLGSKFEKYFDSSWALAQDWNQNNPNTKDKIDNFYTQTPHYLYNSVIFHESGDRYDLSGLAKEITTKYSIKTVLDYGCGVGNDTLMLLKLGMEVYFADFPSPSINFLKWRLEKYGYKNYFENHYIDITKDHIIPEVQMVWAVDVIEHMYEPNEIFEYFSQKTKMFFTYIDSAEENSGRHPFHFSVNCQSLADTLKDKHFSIYRQDGHLCIWQKSN